MKVAILVFGMEHALSGFVPYTEDLFCGFKEAGHEPRLFYVVHKEPSGRDLQADSVEELECGLMIRTLNNRGYLSARSRYTWVCDNTKHAHKIREELEAYDLIVSTSYPFDWRFDNLSWTEVIPQRIPHFQIVHTAFDVERKPWLCMGNWTGYIAISPGAWETSWLVPGDLYCIPNPFDVGTETTERYVKDHEQICIASMYISWKHLPRAIRAVPYMKPYHLVSMGGGIILDYLRSKQHREEYDWKEDDPGVKPEWIGKRVWDVAERSGHFKYLGFIPPRKVRKVQAQSVALLDFCERRGADDHFNRTLVEAIIADCVPFVTKNALGEVFTEKNVVVLPSEDNPKETGGIITDALYDTKRCKELIKNNRKMLGQFSRQNVAEQMINLLQGTIDKGEYRYIQGQPTQHLLSVLRPYGFPPRFPREKK